VPDGSGNGAAGDVALARLMREAMARQDARVLHLASAIAPRSRRISATTRATGKATGIKVEICEIDDLILLKLDLRCGSAFLVVLLLLTCRYRAP
jgi:hypothetical protein